MAAPVSVNEGRGGGGQEREPTCEHTHCRPRTLLELTSILWSDREYHFLSYPDRTAVPTICQQDRPFRRQQWKQCPASRSNEFSAVLVHVSRPHVHPQGKGPDLRAGQGRLRAELAPAGRSGREVQGWAPPTTAPGPVEMRLPWARSTEPTAGISWTRSRVWRGLRQVPGLPSRTGRQGRNLPRARPDLRTLGQRSVRGGRSPRGPGGSKPGAGSPTPWAACLLTAAARPLEG